MDYDKLFDDAITLLIACNRLGIPVSSDVKSN